MQPAGFQTWHWQTEWVASLETRNAQDPWIKWATLPSKQASFFVVLAATIAALSSIMMGSCVEGFLKALQSDTHLYWTPASLVNEECSASFLGATNRCILQLHAPSCLHSEPFVRRRCYSKVGTPAEFKLGSPEWSNARIGWQDVPVSMVLFLLCNQWI